MRRVRHIYEEIEEEHVEEFFEFMTEEDMKEAKWSETLEEAFAIMMFLRGGFRKWCTLVSLMSHPGTNVGVKLLQSCPGSG